MKFTTSGDVGTANVTVRQNTTADKVGEGTRCRTRLAVPLGVHGCLLHPLTGGVQPLAARLHPCAATHAGPGGGGLRDTAPPAPPPCTSRSPLSPTKPPTPLPPPQKEDQTIIDLKEPVALTFALRYLTSFAKATPLATHVTLSMTRELPVMVRPAPSCLAAAARRSGGRDGRGRAAGVGRTAVGRRASTATARSARARWAPSRSPRPTDRPALQLSPLPPFSTCQPIRWSMLFRTWAT